MMLSLHLVTLVQLLCGCLFVPVQSQTTVSRPNIPVQSSQCDSPQLTTVTIRIPPNSVTIDPTTVSGNAAAMPTTFKELPTASTNSKQSTFQCTAKATTVGVISAIITALLGGGICIAIDIAVYQYFYKPKLRTFYTSTTVGSHDESHSQREGITGNGDAIAYEVVIVNERVGAGLEMRENEAYSASTRVEGPEMKENKAYSASMRVEGSEMKVNEEAYCTSTRVEGPEMIQKVNEAYSASTRVEGPEMKENEAYSASTRVEGPEMKENEAYSATTRVEGREMKENKGHIVDNRVEMRENEAYSIIKRMKGPETKENEAYSASERVDGPERKENEAYSASERVEGPEMKENEAYSASERVEGPEMEENEAYSASERVEGPEMEENEALSLRST